MSLETRKRKHNSRRLGKCDVCRSTDARYTCPRCETVTCSLICVKKHKKDLDCDGVRVRTKYIPVDKMNEHSLLSDYRLLEDIRRCVEVVEWQRESLEAPQQAIPDSTSEHLVRTGGHPNGTSQNNPQRSSINKNQSVKSTEEVSKSNASTRKGDRGWHKAKLRQAIKLGGKKKAMSMECLANAALSRGIYLKSLPERFEKHWENTSFHISYEDCIYWHLKLSFINANFYTLSLNECAETMTLANVVQGCIRRSKDYWEKQGGDDPLIAYRMIDSSKLCALMAADKIPNNQRKFYVLDMTKSLRDNLLGKCVVEFPQICITIEGCHTVSAVHENYAQNFFGEGQSVNDKEEFGNDHFEGNLKRKSLRLDGGKKKRRLRNEESDKESGELTNSSDNGSSLIDTDSQEEESGEELFKESEFRSVYKDLLNTFDSDVNQIQRK